ncbi:prepilin peptidase [Kiloniella litopenaei]|uniref:prepilin peptidase n=1 Tax=Kiloniella litopenaei TaxID=1549748 RepID=UPI003BA88488
MIFFKVLQNYPSSDVRHKITYLSAVALILSYLAVPFLVMQNSLILLDPLFLPILLLVPVFLWISFVDFRKYIIPDWCNIAVLVLSLIYFLSVDVFYLSSHFFGALMAFVISFAVRQIFIYLRDKEVLGFGDVKLFSACGFLLGYEGVPSAILLSSVIGLMLLLVRKIFQKKINTQISVLAFGPCICFGTWVVWWTGPVRFCLGCE